MRLTFGQFVFDSRLRSVTRDGARAPLSPKAFQLLEVLVEARPAPVAKEVLYDRLWPKTFVEPGNLHNLVAEIRRALDDGDHAIVRTIYGEGYSFEAREAAVPLSASGFVVWIGDEVIALRAGENIIGRDPGAAVVIDSADVSRQHARLFVNDDHVIVEDLGSKNGTYIGTERLSRPRVVSNGETVTLGNTAITIRRKGGLESTVSGTVRPSR